MQGSACLRGGETGLRFPVLTAGIYKQDIACKWQSRTNFSPARVFFSRLLRKTCVSRSSSGEGNNAACVRGAQRGRQLHESGERAGTLSERSPARVPAGASCQPHCRFKAKPEEQMITGQLRLHNLFWV